MIVSGRRIAIALRTKGKTIEPNKQKAIGMLRCGRFDTCRRSTLSCWRRTRISATSFVLGLKSEAMIWRISRRNSIIKWQGYRVSPSRLAESNFRTHRSRMPLMTSLARCTAVPSSADADVGLHQRVDPLGQPQQRGTERAVQRELVAAVKQGVAQLREAALDEAALEEPEAAQRTEGVVVAERDQCAEIAEAVWRHWLALPQPSWQMADQMYGLLIGDLCG